MSASLILDIVFCVLSLILIIRYTCKGAIKAVFSFVKTLLAFGITAAFRNPVAAFIDKLFMRDSIVNWVQKSLMATANGTETDGINFVKLYQDTPSFFTNILSKFGMDLNGFDTAIENLEYASESDIAVLSSNIGSSISSILSMLLGMVVVFVLATIVLTIVINLLDKISHLPGINLANRILGAAIGAAISLIIILLASSVINILVKYIGPIAPNTFNEALVSDSIVLRALNDSGIMGLIEKLIQKQ